MCSYFGLALVFGLALTEQLSDKFFILKLFKNSSLGCKIAF